MKTRLFRRVGVFECVVLTLIVCCAYQDAAKAAKTHKEKRKIERYSTELISYTPKTYPDHGLEDEMTEQGRKAMGFYLTPAYLHKVGAEASARVMKRANMTAVVIDVKDDWGNVLWPSEVPLAKEVRRPYMIRDPKGTVDTFHRAGIYVIARIVCFKDSKLPLARPDLSVRYTFDNRRLFRAGAGWIDIYSREVQDYLIDLAREWEIYGVDEIQLDYIRFPKGRMGGKAAWLHQGEDNRPRYQLMTDFLDRADRALKVPLSVDVFGLTTIVDGDPRRLGQTIEEMATHAEAISPMMYANGMTTYFRNNTVTKHLYPLIQCGLWRARLKAPNIVLRPYLQAYPNDVPFYDEAFIKEQVLSTRKAGANGFLFWNSYMKNRVAFRALRQLGRRELDKFGQRTIGGEMEPKRPGQWCTAPGEGNVFQYRAQWLRSRSKKGDRKKDGDGVKKSDSVSSKKPKSSTPVATR